MCKEIRTKRNGVTVLKRHANAITGIGVKITRMTAKSGAHIYAVIVTDFKTGRRRKIYTFDAISKAWGFYKAALA